MKWIFKIKSEEIIINIPVRNIAERMNQFRKFKSNLTFHIKITRKVINSRVPRLILTGVA